MKSAYIVFPEAGKVEVAVEPVEPPAEGEILCQAQKSLISIGTEGYCLRGDFDPGTNWESWVKYPFRPGYCMVSRVIAVGKGVKDLKEGDRVESFTTHQQFFKTLPQNVYRVPDEMSDEEATWMTLACTTQVGVRRAELKLGETVGVVGLGMLGQLVVQYLHVMGARKTIALDPIQMRLDIAKAHGATHTLAIDVKEAREDIGKITAGKMLDIVFDITGHPAVLPSCIPLLRKLGRVVLLGDTPNPRRQHLGPGVVSNSIGILGIHASMTPPLATEFNPWTRREIIELFCDYVVQKRMRVADLVTHRHSPAKAPEVYASLQRDRSSAIGVILDWSML